ncbi:hypothetical protein [Salimicrobium humidisoli]|uniref:hypothetical protein n=1 Tax=Salimicrobium humidisoli TaxID=2029857 RepID=UPI00117B12DA|nr:hypothetical protein [Salimicrobium humidisoli]
MIMVGLSILVFNNYKDATAVPSDSWAREIEIATTPVQSDILSKRRANGNYNFSYFTADGLESRDYSNSLELVDQRNYDIPYNKWTEIIPLENGAVYQWGGHLLFRR